MVLHALLSEGLRLAGRCPEGLAIAYDDTSLTPSGRKSGYRSPPMAASAGPMFVAPASAHPRTLEGDNPLAQNPLGLKNNDLVAVVLTQDDAVDSCRVEPARRHSAVATAVPPEAPIWPPLPVVASLLAHVDDCLDHAPSMGKLGDGLASCGPRAQCEVHGLAAQAALPDDEVGGHDALAHLRTRLVIHRNVLVVSTAPETIGVGLAVLWLLPHLPFAATAISGRVVGPRSAFAALLARAIPLLRPGAALSRHKRRALVYTKVLVDHRLGFLVHLQQLAVGELVFIDLCLGSRRCISFLAAECHAREPDQKQNHAQTA
mmetsp:Transcript_68802/g.191627  ORF Transcript_68802/g.191627 Transcript_68802/m.191627 type:complete len:318 (-) Transcript_68802:206-1159(-)